MIVFDPNIGEYIDDGQEAYNPWSGDRPSSAAEEAIKQSQNQTFGNQAVAQNQQQTFNNMQQAVQQHGVAAASGASGYSDFGQFWQGSGGQTPSDLKSRVDEWNSIHPDDRVSLGGSKGDKATYRGKSYDAVLSAGTGGHGATWNELGSGGDTGGDAVDPSYLAPWTGQFTPPDGAQQPSYAKPSPFNFHDFQGPGNFQQPTGDSILQDPSFQFRMDQGRNAIEHSAAAKGLLNSGGTLGDILKFGQGFASQEYGNVWDRDFKTWDTDWRNALDTYGTDRSNAFGNWSANNLVSQDARNFAQGQSDTSYDRAWQQYQDLKNTFQSNQDRPFSKLSGLVGIGANAAGG